MSEQHLAVMIHEQAEKYNDREVLYNKKGDEWISITWKSMAEQIDSGAKALLEFGTQAGNNVAIFSQNRPEWALSDYSILTIGAVTVTIYATNTPEQAEYIIDDAEINTVFVGGQEQYDAVMKFFGKNSNLKKVVVFEETTKIDAGPDVIYYEDFLNIGRQSNRDNDIRESLEKAKTDDICTIIYTSGTTGNPKGALLTHANFYCQFNALNQRYPMGENDIELCFIPLSHVYERCSSFWVLSKGARIYYCEDTSKIVDYFQEVRPSYMVGVPRLYEKMYAAIHEQLKKASGTKQKLFMWGVETGKQYRYKKIYGQRIPLSLTLKHAIAYTLVLKKVRALLGGKLNFFSAGGAPLSKDIEEFFFAANIFIAQGYGLTETAPIITCNYPGKFKFGTVGSVIPDCEVRFAEDGEILTRGKNVTQGYFKKPDQNMQSFTDDGWFKTGDIGYIDEEGFLHITDRKKDIIVTAGGKNIAPQYIQSVIGQDFFIEQIVVIGDRKKFLSALIVPSFDALKEYAGENNISFTSNEDLAGKQEIIDFYTDRINKLSEKLAHHEKIQKFILMPKEFSQDDGEITPTMKIKRKVIQERYSSIINKMYE